MHIVICISVHRAETMGELKNKDQLYHFTNMFPHSIF